ncbi:RNA dependent RNA polymerase-domain-containing protein [Lactarius psammicola]|nr:RNA dependent RNA polymerase-domain-containing protein [Lactarius psammicola]
MDARGLPWGVQWEIARLVSLGYCAWNNITMLGLDYLKNNGFSPSPSDSPGPARVLNARVAPHVEDLFRSKKHSFGGRKTSREALATSPWQELDREDAAFRQYGPNGCLGFTPELGSWYGGKVTFTTRLCAAKDGGFTFHLEHPVLGPSSRFTRTYGSAWLIRVRISKEIFSKADLSEKLRTLLVKPLILNGVVFRFFYANKDHNAYLMATNEPYAGTRQQSPLLNGPNRLVSFLDFFSIHNNLMDNRHQTIAKWAARTALGLSNSVPGLALDVTQIREEVDVVSSSCPPGVKPSSEMDMTDGCGLINLQALHALHEQLSLWGEVPTAVQCRIAGAKGLLLQHPGKEENGWTYPCVWLRPSQIKIRLSDGFLNHPSHCIIDVLRASHMQSPIQISREMVTNLAENGVPPTILAELFCYSLSSTIDSLLDWDGQDAMPRLWATIFKMWNVMGGRIARESTWTARARGVQLYEQEDDSEDEDAEDTDSFPQSTAWWGDDISGCPSTLEETVMAFLDSGFHPASNAILAEKLHIMVKSAVKSRMSKYRVTVPMSCAAYVVPDPLGVLEEGEIHVKSSQRSLIRPDGQKSERVVGDVLVTRSPCKLPTDVQKVKAVFKPELDDYVNVIVFSIKGPRSLASMLGTGDYDGDRVDCIWEPSIVEHFKNSDPKYAEPPAKLSELFHVKNETVDEFLERVPPTSTTTNHQVQELQQVFMAPLRDLFVVGTYSTMHDNAIYALGYTHPMTTLLAWIFCTVLDGAKTGKTILSERYLQDRNSRKYGTQYVPEWKAAQDNLVHHHPLSRQGLPTFVMDVLKAAMDEASSTQFQRIDAQFSALPRIKDTDLIAPWQEAEAGAQELLSRPEPHAQNVGRAQQDALDAIKKHVMGVYELSSTLMKPGGGEKGKKKVAAAAAAAAAFTGRSIELRQDLLRQLSREFVSGPDREETVVGLLSEDEVARLRASFAYVYDWTCKPGGTRFPWNVAMRELSAIKLRARRDLKPLSQDFYEKMLMRRL